MLQQTQVDRVIPKFLAWRQAWPTTKSLAQAPLQDILQMWSGLGYNSRALRLRQAARVVMKKHGGQWPKTVEELEDLPGFGPYTARAVASFAYNQNIATVDTNIRRILSRVFFGVAEVSTKNIEQLATEIVPSKKSVQWHGALMDFGSAVCTSRNPKCGTCPLQTMCRAYPAVLTQERVQKKNSVRFEHTDRYWRGAIMRELLQHSPQATSSIIRALKKVGGVDNKRVVRLLQALCDAKLIEYHQHRYQISS